MKFIPATRARFGTRESEPLSFEVTWIPDRLSLRQMSVPCVQSSTLSRIPCVPLYVCWEIVESHASNKSPFSACRIALEQRPVWYVSSSKRQRQGAKNSVSGATTDGIPHPDSYSGKRFIVYPAAWVVELLRSFYILRPRGRECV